MADNGYLKYNRYIKYFPINIFKAQAQASTLEKKQKKVDLQINEWRMKCDELQADLDKSQRDSRSYSTEVIFTTEIFVTRAK